MSSNLPKWLRTWFKLNVWSAIVLSILIAVLGVESVGRYLEGIINIIVLMITGLVWLTLALVNGLILIVAGLFYTLFGGS